MSSTPFFDGTGNAKRNREIAEQQVPTTPPVPAADKPTPEIPSPPAPSSTGRPSLSSILRQGDAEKLARAWNDTAAATDFTPLPAGVYIARVLSGKLFETEEKCTPGYKLAFRVLEGPYEGRQFWHDIWLTDAAMSMAKRELKKIGITSPEQLASPLPLGIRCKVKLALRRNNDGSEYNSVKSFAVVGIDPPEAEPFAPSINPSTPPQSPLAAAGGASR